MKKILIILFFILLILISYFLFFKKTEPISPPTQNQGSTFPSFTQNNQIQNTSSNSNFQEGSPTSNNGEIVQNISEEDRVSSILQKNIDFWKETKDVEKIKEIIVFASTIDVESSLVPIELLLASSALVVFEQIQEDEVAVESFYSLLNWFVAGSNYFNILSQVEKNEITKLLNSAQ